MVDTQSTSTPVVVLISGPSCTGKTTLAERLATDLRWPLFAKDNFKEPLFDTLGWSDRAWSRKLGMASIAILYCVIERELAAGRPLITESTFRPEWDTSIWRTLAKHYRFSPLQIACWAQGDVLWERWQERTSSGTRHPGHVERENAEEFRPGLLRGRVDPLAIGGELIELETTDFARVDYDALLQRIRALSGSAR